VIRIEAPHFVAAVVLGPLGRVVRAAPIVAYMIGWLEPQVTAYCRHKGWEWSVS